MEKENNKANVTVQDIAAAANISASTVSRALNNHPKISQKTKEKVWEIARQLGYQPNIPVYMNQEKSNAICLMVPELNNDYYLEIIEQVKKQVLKEGYHIYIAPTNNNLEEEKAYIKSVINLKMEGVIIALFNTHNDLSHIKSLINLNIPTVLLNKNESDIDATMIIPDVFHGAYKATKHLASMKCKSIHLFTENPENPLFSDLIEGYQTALEELKFSDIKKHIHNLNEKEQANKTLDQLYELKQLPDGIISGNSKITEHLISWYENKGLNIPEDVLLVSFEPTDKNQNNQMISSIRFSGSKIGKTAIDRLFKQIKKGKVKKETVIIPAGFIIRGSSIRV